MVGASGCEGPGGIADGGVDTDEQGTYSDADVDSDADCDADCDANRDAGTDAASDGDIDADTDADTDADIEPLIGPEYPVRNSYQIKGIQPDDANPTTMAGNNLNNVGINIVWYVWEGTRQSAPCGANQQQYDGYCYTIDSATDNAIETWTNLGVAVTGIIWGVPQWAKVANCSPYTADPWFNNFCAPDNGDDFGRFAGMLAQRYNDSGNGRVADFVIHNEINHNIWFDVGCGSGTPCDKYTWVQTYADSFNPAYDRIKAEQSQAKVLLSFDQHFDSSLTNMTAEYPLMGSEEFLQLFEPLAGDRKWKVAFHPYSAPWGSQIFGPKDLPYVTFGNMGVIVGYLMAQFPGHPHAWEVLLTEQGINSNVDGFEAGQDAAICKAYRNALGTPGISTFIYYRYKDFGALEGGSAMGLVSESGVAKTSLSTWLNMNQAGSYDCGFEDLPYTVVRRGIGPGGHWASSRALPGDFTQEAAWKLLRDREAGTQMVFECAVGNHNLLTLDQSCGGNQPMGPVGWIWTSPQAGTVALYACSTAGDADHFISTDSSCEGMIVDGLLGYVTL